MKLHAVVHRVPGALSMYTQGAHTGLKTSYICVSICRALQSLISGLFLSKRSYKVLFLLEKNVSELRNVRSKIT